MLPLGTLAANAQALEAARLDLVEESVEEISGLIAAEGHAVDRQTHSVWWIGQSLFGGGTLLCSLFTSPLQMTHTLAHHDLGVILCTVAGLMNLVVMVDAFTVAEKQGLVAAEVPA